MSRVGMAIITVLGALLSAASARAELSGGRLDGEVAVLPNLFGASEYSALGVGAVAMLGSTLELSAGGRLLLGHVRPNPGLSGFVRGTFGAVEGYWRPALGMELEATTATHSLATRDEIEGSLSRAYDERDRGNTFRAGMVLLPIRGCMGRLLAAAAGIRLSTPLSRDAGHRLYVALTLIQLGWVL